MAKIFAASDFAVSIQNLTHHYGDNEALHQIDLDLPAGQTIGLVGPDGVGKSTLLGIISGVKRLQSGKVTTLDADIGQKKQREAVLPRVAFMPQGLGHNLYPTLSVQENIDFFARLFGLDAEYRKTRIAQLLEATSLAPFFDRPAGKLSGGMKQKVSLCCALVHNPDLLILDEPTTGVDPLSRQQFWELVDALQAGNPSMTVIVSTAYMEEAARFSWLVAMDDGKILANGKTADILKQTGQDTVEKAYISLLPEEKRTQASGFSIPPYQNTDPEPAIEANNLTCRFGSFTAVDNVSFRIGRGEIFGFLGSNGCGKSTTMKMLTGLLDATSGTAKLFGKPVSAGDLNTRMRIGYMSQAFSLYEELTVKQNLVLQSRLYRATEKETEQRVDDALDNFELRPFADISPADLPLGIRQRLQLAAACINTPDILILDEPTSGVDPAARDMFWHHLIDLSRNKHVTIFVSTHFMNEAACCDRISLMHRGHVLAVGTPDELMKKRGETSLEAAFIDYLQDQMSQDKDNRDNQTSSSNVSLENISDNKKKATSSPLWHWLSYVWAFARRESLELLRDKLRLTFAVAGPIILLLVSAYSISFDINKISFTVCDQDQSNESRSLVKSFQGSSYFTEKAASSSLAEMNKRLSDGTAQMTVDIPAGFGRDIEAGRHPSVGIGISGAMPFLGANIQSYATNALLQYAQLSAQGLTHSAPSSLPFSIEPRFVYNQEFLSIYTMVPDTIMLALILIPTMLTALGVVREKEIGSIINLYASPASTRQYLIGKQLPYVAIAMLAYLSLVVLSVTILGVPLKGSFLALSLGALLYNLAATGLGLLISTFVSSQVAAIFGTAILCLIPAVNFSGLLYPVSTLTGISYHVGRCFPASWFQLISLGSFTKGLGFTAFLTMYGALTGFALLYLALACVLLRKQEL
ncbi:ribosome-associated ATPase/putative transporter RbbA [Zymomonas sp.]|uniref:ribosome-associated ATPase/putative transporter RbbA n=1 Tax=Zymomonas sp. TaxID=2068624 RepID=UPI0025DEE0B1|nr:ribosome-associated ATPase/putative transporter RbbA [Zymomonas sp.]MCA1955358.1 ribosome-associated ATPase/putative transporter RbbA [Zymomonas sp.]